MFITTLQMMLKIDMTPNYGTERPLPKNKNQKVIGLMKDELGGKIMTEVEGLRLDQRHTPT